MKYIMIPISIVTFIVLVASMIQILISYNRRKPRLSFIFFLNNQNVIAMTIQTKGQVTIAGKVMEPIDKYGNKSAVQTGSLSLTSSDESIATVQGEEGNNNFVVKTTGKAGVVQITAKADADLGEEVKEISGFFGVEVASGEAVGFAEFVIGEPVEVTEDQPATEA